MQGFIPLLDSKDKLSAGKVKYSNLIESTKISLGKMGEISKSTWSRVERIKGSSWFSKTSQFDKPKICYYNEKQSDPIQEQNHDRIRSPAPPSSSETNNEGKTRSKSKS